MNSLSDKVWIISLAHNYLLLQTQKPNGLCELLLAYPK